MGGESKPGIELDATHMGCAEAKYHKLGGVKGIFDATHMGCAEAKHSVIHKHTISCDATHMGCAEAKIAAVSPRACASGCNPHGMR